ncbi:MAG: hypothetical protein NXI31_13045 [bacterium]|nr:hypothetical protein [bacterium]
MRALLRPTLALLTLSAVSVDLTAQRVHPLFRLEVGGGFGSAFHETESSAVDGDTGGGIARVRFEGVGRHGFGGGIRLEGWGSDDDLFVDEGFAAEESRAGAIFGHFTYRFERGRFRMPARIGIMVHNYELSNVATGMTTLEVDSFASRFEVAPEFVFHRNGPLMFSGYAELGIAGGYSLVDVPSLNNDFDSSSVFWFAEIGARARFAMFEFGTAFVTHGMVMAESDTENGNFVNSFGAGFTGVIFTGALVF